MKCAEVTAARHLIAAEWGFMWWLVEIVKTDRNKKGEWTKKYRACNGIIRCDFSFDDIGREVFTTEYDAEYAIEEIKKNELSRNLSASDSE